MVRTRSPAGILLNAFFFLMEKPMPHNECPSFDSGSFTDLNTMELLGDSAPSMLSLIKPKQSACLSI